MPSDCKKSKLFQNSIVLYVRLVIVTLIKLWATKILLKNLGAESFGLYNLLAGVIAMLAFLKVAMANASQRFISVSLGKNDQSTEDVFYTSFVLHLIVAVLVLVCIAVGGCFMVESILNIPQGSRNTSLVIMFLLSLSTFSTIVSVPFDSMMVSKENIPTLSIFVVVEALVILLGAYAVGFYDGNRLLLYCCVIVSGTLILFFLRVGLCRHLYKETRFSFHKLDNYTIFKGILKYVGWNVVSSLLVILRNQGFAILFNLAGGVVINAAYGIANQVNALFNYCTEAVMQPNRPVIMKAYGAGDVNEAVQAATFATKVIMLISSACLVILFVNMPLILDLWLGRIPDYTVYFCCVILVATFLVQFSQGAKTLVESTGNVKELFAHIGAFHFLTLALGVGVYAISESIELSITPLIVEEIVCSMYRIFLMKKYLNARFFSFMCKCGLVPLVIVSVAILLLNKLSDYFSPMNFLFFSSIFSIVFLITLFLVAVFSKQERLVLSRFFGKLKSRML